MSSSFAIDNQTVKKNIEALQKFINDKQLDAFYISSFDTFLNEYVPMEDCHRFYISNFSGSVAEALVPAKGRVKLYVDGRYHEQADNEVDATLVEVVKVPSNQGLFASLKEDIKTHDIKTIGLEAQRCPLSHFKDFNTLCSSTVSFQDELSSFINFAPLSDKAPIYQEPKEDRGPDTKQKLERIIENKNQGYYITAIDSLSWLTNCRGFHLPNLSSFVGRGLATFDKVYVFVDPKAVLDESAKNIEQVEFIHLESSEIEQKLKELQQQYNLEKLNIDPGMLNASDYSFLLNVFGEKILFEEKGGLVKFHSIKCQEEIDVIKRNFAKGDKAIFNTIKWVKDKVASGDKVSEYDLWAQTSVEYEKQGSKEQSFGTISGVGPNGSIIHYGDPKKDVYINKDDMVLLDSGGYFHGGFATDTTRTFMGGECVPHPDYVKMYTHTLKGVLQVQYAVFPEGTSGVTLDAYARKSLFDHGHNYAHGTGHGVGIHVHESGVNISPRSPFAMKEGQVVSIEPGIYLPGFGGVRIENIALVVKHPKHEGFLCFEPLVYIGLEPSLIDEALLTEQEKVWLEDYEAICKQRGTSFQSN